MLLLLLIGLQLNASFVMLKIHISLVLPSDNLLLHFLVPFQMLIGQDVLRIDALLEVLLFSLVQIWFLGLLGNKILFLALVLKLNIKHWRMPLQN
jgi:hypothetical protein